MIRLDLPEVGVPDRVSIKFPEFDMPLGGLNIRWPDDWIEQEHRLHQHKISAARRFDREQPISPEDCFMSFGSSTVFERRDESEKSFLPSKAGTRL